MAVTDSLQEHREEIIELATKHGATDVRVFGSAARGEADEWWSCRGRDGR